MKYTRGIKKEFGTYHPDTIYDANGNAICLVYGTASNVKLEELEERNATGLKIAQMIVDALNRLDATE